ncbi:hypothetical protein ACYOEI_24370 [Singulisphaera rosea]
MQPEWTTEGWKWIAFWPDATRVRIDDGQQGIFGTPEEAAKPILEAIKRAEPPEVAAARLRLPEPDQHGRYQFADGSVIQPSSRGKYIAFWPNRVPLRGDNDETSYFNSPEEAAVPILDNLDHASGSTQVKPTRPDSLERSVGLIEGDAERCTLFLSRVSTSSDDAEYRRAELCIVNSSLSLAVVGLNVSDLRQLSEFLEEFADLLDA